MKTYKALGYGLWIGKEFCKEKRALFVPEMISPNVFLFNNIFLYSIEHTETFLHVLQKYTVNLC